MGTITFNGVTSTSKGIKVWTAPEYITPEKDVTAVHVPGRNGDILIDNGVYKNTIRTYQVSLYDRTHDYAYLAHAISDWVHNGDGYKRLEDSYDSAYYRMAVYVDSLQMSNVYNKAAVAKLSFSCKPQRFLKSGESEKTATAANLKNDTLFTARPKLIVTKSGSGTASFTLAGTTVTIASGSPTTITIDSELRDCYYTGNNNSIQNGNIYVSLTNGYPTLPPGNNSVTGSENISLIKVVPNWWTI